MPAVTTCQAKHCHRIYGGERSRIISCNAASNYFLYVFVPELTLVPMGNKMRHFKGAVFIWEQPIQPPGVVAWASTWTHASAGQSHSLRLCITRDEQSCLGRLFSDSLGPINSTLHPVVVNYFSKVKPCIIKVLYFIWSTYDAKLSYIECKASWMWEAGGDNREQRSVQLRYDIFDYAGATIILRAKEQYAWLSFCPGNIA